MGCEFEIARGGGQAAMAQQQLDGSQVDAGFEQMCGKAWRRLCGVIGLERPELWRNLWQACSTVFLEIGFCGSFPGKSQGEGRYCFQ